MQRPKVPKKKMERPMMKSTKEKAELFTKDREGEEREAGEGGVKEIVKPTIEGGFVGDQVDTRRKALRILRSFLRKLLRRALRCGMSICERLGDLVANATRSRGEIARRVLK
jgi:hypothetical protein